MRSWRYLPPAHSPVSMEALAAGIRALVQGAPDGLERWLALRYQVDAALLVDSGTSALRLAIASVAVRSGPRVRVALPAYGCYDLATAALGAGAEVSFYDVDPATLGPDWPSLTTALAAGADALVLVHQYGIPVDLGRARALADAHGAIVIEDAAQGVGGRWRHRRLGASGDLGILSFGRGKGMTAGGGGALLASGTRGQALLEGSRRRVTSSGRGLGGIVKLAAQALLSDPMLYGVPARMPWLALGDTPFHEPWEPRGLDATCAGVLREAADLADEEAGTRRRVAARLEEALRGISGVTLIAGPVGEGTLAGWLRFPVVLDDAGAAKTVVGHCRHLGVAPGYPMPLPELPIFHQARTLAHWPGAARLASQLVTLPTHRWVADDDVARLHQVLAHL